MPRESRSSGSSLNTIGGTLAGAGNLISGNLGDGIDIDKSGEDATGNEILGNLIGTTAAGQQALANKGDGIQINGASSNQVGDSEPGAGNVISGNLGNGIELSSATTGNLILGNLVGTTVDGQHALGNQDDGLRLDGATLTTIGGITAGDGNVIASNQGNGIETVDSAINNLIEGNQIGTDRSGLLVLGNRGNGVSLGSNSNSIGGLDSGAGNTIAFNGTGSVGAGVQLVGLVEKDSILSNSIHDNAGLGINLGNGPTPNHMPGTPGPNNYQNFPVLSGVQTNGSTTSLSGTLLGSPSSTYTIQIFWSSKPDPSGFGQGQNLLATFTAYTDSTGNATINLALPAAPPPGSVISATATDSSGNTSEFSSDAAAKAVTDLAVSIVGTPDPVGVGNTLTYQVTVTNEGGLDAHDVVLTDQLPWKVAIVSTSATQGSTPTVSGQTITASLGTVAANATATLTIVTTVLPGASLLPVRLGFRHTRRD